MVRPLRREKSNAFIPQSPVSSSDVMRHSSDAVTLSSDKSAIITAIDMPSSAPRVVLSAVRYLPSRRSGIGFAEKS